jgi:hypothetical protein
MKLLHSIFAAVLITSCFTLPAVANPINPPNPVTKVSAVSSLYHAANIKAYDKAGNLVASDIVTNLNPKLGKQVLSLVIDNQHPATNVIFTDSSDQPICSLQISAEMKNNILINLAPTSSCPYI